MPLFFHGTLTFLFFFILIYSSNFILHSIYNFPSPLLLSLPRFPQSTPVHFSQLVRAPMKVNEIDFKHIKLGQDQAPPPLL